MRASPVRQANTRLFGVLCAIGLIEAYQHFHVHHAGTTAVAALAGSLVLAAMFGAVRAVTARVWISAGQP